MQGGAHPGLPRGVQAHVVEPQEWRTAKFITVRSEVLRSCGLPAPPREGTNHGHWCGCLVLHTQPVSGHAVSMSHHARARARVRTAHIHFF